MGNEPGCLTGHSECRVPRGELEKENWRTRKRGKKLRDSVGDHERGKAVEEKERRMEQTAVGCLAEKKV